MKRPTEITPLKLDERIEMGPDADFPSYGDDIYDAPPSCCTIESCCNPACIGKWACALAYAVQNSALYSNNIYIWMASATVLATPAGGVFKIAVLLICFLSTAVANNKTYLPLVAGFIEKLPCISRQQRERLQVVAHKIALRMSDRPKLAIALKVNDFFGALIKSVAGTIAFDRFLLTLATTVGWQKELELPIDVLSILTGALCYFSNLAFFSQGKDIENPVPQLTADIEANEPEQYIETGIRL